MRTCTRDTLHFIHQRFWRRHAFCWSARKTLELRELRSRMLGFGVAPKASTARVCSSATFSRWAGIME
ncbi:hypothetical protein B0O99DRAFT_633276 [Bisporella sp. PMI_857]|nr:hypothetical protein B0O99DRAFT_633276 [Bisporella sp. PMI_857]